MVGVALVLNQLQRREKALGFTLGTKACNLNTDKFSYDTTYHRV